MNSRRIRFEAVYPWGSSYCTQLRAALEELGFVTADDPINEGSDIDGFLVAATEQALAAALDILTRELSERGEEFSSSEEDDEGDVFFEWLFDVHDRLAEIGVHQIEQDWKHLDWQGNSLEDLGVEVVRIEEEEDEESWTFEVWRTADLPRPSS